MEDVLGKLSVLPLRRQRISPGLLLTEDIPYVAAYSNKMAAARLGVWENAQPKMIMRLRQLPNVAKMLLRLPDSQLVGERVLSEREMKDTR